MAIDFDGGGQLGDTLVLAGGGGPVLHSTYTPGLSPGAAESVTTDGYRTRTVSLSGVTSIVDVVPTATLTVRATDQADQIRIGAQPIAGGVSLSTVLIDAFPSLNFLQKGLVDVLALGGNDSVAFDHPGGANGQAGWILDGGAGDDLITVALSPVPLTILGGDGDDVLRGGPEDDLMLGGAGADRLFGGPGRDVMIGGLGGDMLDGGEEDDLLIGGVTAYDTQTEALDAILAEWASSRSLATRVRNILGLGTGPRLNGPYFLGPAGSQSDDGAVDLLNGGAGSDWFLLGVLDVATDPTTSESDRIDQVIGLSDNPGG